MVNSLAFMLQYSPFFLLLPDDIPTTKIFSYLHNFNQWLSKGLYS